MAYTPALADVGTDGTSVGMSTLPITVAVCTHNRAGLLAATVAAAQPQVVALGGELLLIDNASTDDTPAVTLELAGRYSGVRVVREPRLGLSAARNRALAETRGAILVYLDDDARPRPDWLATLHEAFDAPEVMCAGGRIVLAFDRPPPAWLSEPLHAALSAYDLGGAPMAVRYGKATYPFGANIAFRVAQARAAGGFSEEIGMRGYRHQLLHEETDLCYRLEQAGGVIRYLPAAVVDHHIVAERLSPRWMLRRYYHTGESAAVFILRNRGVARAVWRVWWHYADALAHLPYDAREPLDPTRFATECRRREALGYVASLVRSAPRVARLRRDMAA